MMKVWPSLLLFALTSHLAQASADATVEASCDAGQSCSAVDTTKGSILLQSRQHVGKGAVKASEELSEEPDALEPDAATLALLAEESSVADALADNASGASEAAAVFSCPGSCQWCQPFASYSEVKKTSDIKYGKALSMATNQQEDLFLDMYVVPKKNVIKPVILVIHGGSFLATSTKTSGWAPTVSQLMAQHGFIALSVEYRRYGEYCKNNAACWTNPNPQLEHPVHDIKAAVRFVRKYAAELKADPNRIALWGCSAGGNTVANTIMHNWGEGNSGNAGYSSAVQVGIGLSAASGTDYQRKTSGTAPYLDFHNQVDSYVPYENAKENRDYLTSIGAVGHLITLAGSGHCPNIFTGSGSRMEDFMGFLARHLQLPGSSCPNSGSAPPPAPPAPPAPAPPPPPPAPEAGCPAQCSYPSCRSYDGSGAAWSPSTNTCTGWCSAYNNKMYCTTKGYYSNPVDCTACR